MKKIVLIAFSVLFLVSCGPKRLGCGPGRCEVKFPSTVNLDIDKTKVS